eukprot:TRINITY_DN15383_c0_g1_i2.p1 TRINITY_DN15383_c0_g1~~TRINITY_DN15383_c0_g1_i2.p1  ORF type:complete len:330 (-),score=56.88 TRINITY_DN15383_c0_g1_i2:255-1244(-)
MACSGFTDASACLSQTYRFMKTLNSGNFGIVYSCENVQSGEVLACKVVRKGECEDLSSLRQEVHIMEKLAGQSNIVQIHDVLEDEENMYIFMELCDGGDLFDKIQAKGRFPEAMARSAFRQIVKAANFCHQKGIAHRDIKPENVLLKSPRGMSPCDDSVDECELKLADFGCSAHCPAGETLNGFYGSHHYMAPEIVVGEGHAQKADIWSLGVLLFALLSGGLPFLGYKANEAEEDEDLLFEAILDGAYDMESGGWQCISQSAKDLVSLMLAADQEKRPSTAEILLHPWLLGARSFDAADSSSEGSVLSRENSLSRRASFSSCSQYSDEE